MYYKHTTSKNKQSVDSTNDDDFVLYRLIMFVCHHQLYTTLHHLQVVLTGWYGHNMESIAMSHLNDGYIH